ncbi:MAG: transcription-repair coupling factor, partial [Lachnospiraceae bacterium]|nr:transcription-repair coupling factor [Lachnospiraceae bacterium]
MRALQLLSEPGAPAVLAEGCAESQKLHLIYALSQESGVTSHARMRLILTYDELRARKIRDEYLFYERGTVLFPAKDLIFYQADLKSREIQIERLRCLRRLIEGRPLTVVTTFSALMTPQIPLRVLKDNILRIEKGRELTTEFFSASLVAMGYEKCVQVETPGQFSVRGDILDVYDLTEENPYRIELWGDEVESIRSFDALTQRSMQTLEAVRIYPATEMILPADRVRDGLVRMQEEADRCVRKLREEGHPEAAHRLQTGVEEQIEQARDYGNYAGLESYIHYFYPMTESFLSLFPRDYTTIWYDEPGKIRSSAEAVELEFRESMIGRAQAGLALPGQMELLQSAERTQAELEQFPRMGLTLSLTGADLFRGREEEGQSAIGNNAF